MTWCCKTPCFHYMHSYGACYLYLLLSRKFAFVINKYLHVLHLLTIGNVSVCDHRMRYYAWARFRSSGQRCIEDSARSQPHQYQVPNIKTWRQSSMPCACWSDRTWVSVSSVKLQLDANTLDDFVCSISFVDLDELNCDISFNTHQQSVLPVVVGHLRQQTDVILQKHADAFNSLQA